jgi:hypothetical protein
MADIGFGSAGIVAAGWAGRKLVGPLFDEIAEDWRHRYSERRMRNLNRIGRIAQAKLGSEIDDRGQVPPRVLLRVMEEGSWCDGPVMAEYFGGILAASRSADGTSDRGASWAGLVSRLSTLDVHLHYLAYDAFRRTHLDRSDLNLGLSVDRDRSEVFLPGPETLAAMGFDTTAGDWSQVIVPAINALLREDLLGQIHGYGPPEYLETSKQIDAPDSGLVFTPSVAGLELFLWAHGMGQLAINFVLTSEVTFRTEETLVTVDGARSVVEMRKARTERLANEQPRRDVD